MDAEVPAAARVSFIVRIVPRAHGPLSGIVERIGTGEKHRFEGMAELGRVIERTIGAQQSR